MERQIAGLDKLWREINIGDSAITTTRHVIEMRYSIDLVFAIAKWQALLCDIPTWARGCWALHEGEEQCVYLNDPWDFGLMGDAQPYKHLDVFCTDLWRKLYDRRAVVVELDLWKKRRLRKKILWLRFYFCISLLTILQYTWSSLIGYLLFVIYVTMTNSHLLSCSGFPSLLWHKEAK